MKKSVNDILIEILTIAGYSGDKEKFVAEFEELNVFEAITHIYDTLPHELQENIKTHSNNPYEMQKYIPQRELINEVIKVTRVALHNCIKDMLPALNSFQKEKINNLAVTL
ncbi:MAG TPA: hypothetical protein VLF93_00780 [Candidatus Saccharimonadales bacterium]|nr:hypothetical protein [Candidatus Saccharimonadales bacterium]